MLSMVLQLAGLGLLFIGIAAAATGASDSVNPDSKKGKLHIWYSDVTVTSLRQPEGF
jgi:hypothetical protein